MGAELKDVVSKGLKNAQTFKSKVSNVLQGDSIEEIRNTMIENKKFVYEDHERSKLDSHRQWKKINLNFLLSIVAIIIGIVSIVLQYI